MKARILIAFLAAGIGILVAHVPPAQLHRIGPAEIYSDPATTSVTLRQGQEILAGDWEAWYVSIEKERPCK